MQHSTLSICSSMQQSMLSSSSSGQTLNSSPGILYEDGNTAPPRSPRTPPPKGSMSHNVNHRFTKTIMMKPTICFFCAQKFSILGGLKCKECGIKVHKECEKQVAPSCKLPQELLEVFQQTYEASGGADWSLRTPPILSSVNQHSHAHQAIDSSSTASSCNSSTPSSPALVMHPPPSPSYHKKMGPHSPNCHKRHELQHNPPSPRSTPPLVPPHFNYPEITKEVYGIRSLTSTVSSTLSAGRNEFVDSTNSGSTDDSDRTLAGRVNSQDSGEDVRCSRQNSVSHAFKEWDIPYDELDRGKVIGKGRFGTVYSGNWHGQVAIKELHMNYVQDNGTLEMFRREVSTFRKTRHQNLVLFMGACMRLPRLAIVTSLCKGNTLYTHLHILKDRFTLANTVSIANQAAQGMGYLHARGILHKGFCYLNLYKICFALVSVI